MSFPKAILRFTSFLLGFAILLAGASWFLEPKNNSYMWNLTANGFLGEKENTIDVMIVGDSESFTSFSPMQMWRDYGYTVYDCGTSRQYVEDAYNFLRRFTKTQKPKVVFLETNLFYRSDGFFEDASRAMQNAINEVIPIFDYHHRWKLIHREDLFRNAKYTWRDPLKGFRLDKKIVPYEGPSDYMTDTNESEPIATVCEYYLREMLDHCKELNIELVLISVISPVNWSTERHNAVSALAEKYGIKYLDLNMVNDELQIDWSRDTYDKGDHLNFYGAQKATDYLARYIQKNFALTDHRGDEKYSHWDTDLEIYEKKIGKP